MGSIIRLLQDLLYRYAKIPHHMVNKFTITGFIFFIWVGFIGKSSFLENFQLRRIINQLESEKERYTKEIEIVKQDKLDLENNQEKYAREKYFMHANDEDVFIIERK